MTVETRITRLFDIELPLLLGGMMWLSDARLVAAVVKAGGMGFIASRAFNDPGRLTAEIRQCQALAEGRPVGVNLTLSRRSAMNHEVADLADAALKAGVRHFETAGMPPDELLPRLKDAGATVIHKCAHIRHAQSAERRGVDAIALVGMEEGGHPGDNQLPTFLNGAYALERLEVPVAIGGGIGHGRQIAAALAMGADAVVMGSRFTVAAETPAHPRYKERVLAIDEHGTRALLSSLRDTWRVLDNENARKVAAIEAAGARQYTDFGDLISGQRSKQLAYDQGQHEEGMLSLGPAAGFADRVEPAGDIVSRLWRQCEHALGQLRSRQVVAH